MKNFRLLFLILPLLAACEEDEPDVVSEELRDWETLIIPNGREAEAIVGNIDDTLMVTTMMSAYFTADGGETWQESEGLGGTVFDVLERNDTVYALWATGLRDYVGPPFVANQRYAGLATQFTMDYGITWQRTPYQDQHSINSPVGIATSPSGVTYRIKDNITPLNADTTSYRTNYSTVEMYHEGRWQTIDFPFEYVLNNIHVDEDNRLYVSADSWQYVQDNQITGPDENYPGLVYMYKHPLP
ncbi:hypothetical protein [Tunicatimonas pelagia]|uniref:hypothetical protein n=1 Tax=Tunicatimonas pelagia TaxID=931531 RepID=UPI0026651EB4|nr:hypothetical protein [Tunicatimonas pelagia]WKN42980.1 hypothetical protein P0M28_28480 [Tunicatimonas pelagia]